jgi:hypothetical protein
VGARPHKVDQLGLNLVNQQKIASDVAFPVIGPCAFQGVIQPLGAEGSSLSRTRSKRPECNRRCQSFKNALA